MILVLLLNKTLSCTVGAPCYPMASVFHFPIEFCPSFRPFCAFCVLSLCWRWSGSALSFDGVSPFCCQVLLNHKRFHWFPDGCPSIFRVLLSFLSVRYSFCDQISADVILCLAFLSIGNGNTWSGSAWLPLVTAVQNGLPLSLNEFFHCLSKCLPAQSASTIFGGRLPLFRLILTTS
jgi:hypothetical protein